MRLHRVHLGQGPGPSLNSERGRETKATGGGYMRAIWGESVRIPESTTKLPRASWERLPVASPAGISSSRGERGSN